MVTASSVTRSTAPPLNRPRGAASATVPVAAAPAGITVLPATSTGFATVAEKLSPAWLVFDPTAWPSRTVMTVSAGTTMGFASAAWFLSPAAVRAGLPGADSRDALAVVDGDSVDAGA